MNYYPGDSGHSLVDSCTVAENSESCLTCLYPVLATYDVGCTSILGPAGPGPNILQRDPSINPPMIMLQHAINSLKCITNFTWSTVQRLWTVATVLLLLVILSLRHTAATLQTSATADCQWRLSCAVSETLIRVDWHFWDFDFGQHALFEPNHITRVLVRFGQISMSTRHAARHSTAASARAWPKCWRRPAYHRHGAGWGYDGRQRGPTQLCREDTTPGPIQITAER